MKCSNGHTVKDDANFCQTCGSTLKKKSSIMYIFFAWMKSFWDDPLGVGIDLIIRLFFISVIIWLVGSIVWGIFGPIFA